MLTTRLANGVTVFYGDNPHDELTLRYPDGSVVRTDPQQFALLRRSVAQLREAYECLLQAASREFCPPIDKLMRIDDLLFAIDHRPGRREDETRPDAAAVCPLTCDRPVECLSAPR